MVDSAQTTPSDSLSWPDLLQQLMDKQSLSRFQAVKLMQGWLNEDIPPVLSGAILTAIQAKGVAPTELAGMAQVLQAQAASPSEALLPTEPVIDTCGTGGDGASTFNISTAVAFVAAAAGIKVAKHGNRSASSKVGSADVLEALGVNLKAPPDTISAALGEVGITFLFAPGWHPAMKAVVPIRKTLKMRTVFNLLGPLVNPLKPTGQVLGVYNPNLVPIVANAILQLGGVQRAIVLHGKEGLDEAGLGDDIVFSSVREGNVSHGVLLDYMTRKGRYPSKLNYAERLTQGLGLSPAPISELRGGEIEENTDILRNVLQGKGTTAQREVVALNASFALQVGEVTPWGEHRQGIEKALDILKSGAAWDKVQDLVTFLKEA
ncbi:anthranilate phosphoribosyltransferase [Roseofilum reptotaenium CS-1145]|uniref:Anthranilate phosphoribosyltransferase n=1 Tax=Roseofilum reptotaenium AO1-A TaxID=1925591 RepID=A0A1L9QU43_9CYAN|nr:anthranilate phosphoribosyltransferase [Roseofilum reptotaenium]MDB9518397.1 anthranilate phosphoribosyltransferase [Roseofilum reptotaenium CS-1145]OJJ26169.1 anthranilate phosphoribosyltransferase [Roseofilum reptotaenium AO1-A]